MANIQIDFYKTKDLAEASMLVVKKQKMTTIQREGRICWFIFSNKEGCEKLANEYYYGDLQVNPREFHEAMSRLKGRIFAQE